MQYAIKRSLESTSQSQGKLQCFDFSPIETPYGSLKVRVLATLITHSCIKMSFESECVIVATE